MNLRHRTTASFWACYQQLPEYIQATADKNYRFLEQDPFYPSLHFKRVGEFWSVRVSQDYRALALEEAGGLYWFWISPHDEYDKILSR